MQRRVENFRRNKRGMVSLVVFLVLFFATLFAEFIANDKPIIVWYEGGIYAPVFTPYSEKRVSAGLSKP